ncbi:MAG TPA: reverse transcriptase domain-containing protein [Azospirillaceae bacterium]|nr:reverse transcriptase domain-containing protein [Azospirillaceae bacterium]
MLPATIEKAIGSLPTVVRSGRRVNGLFRLMKAPLLWELAYQKIASNQGAMTPGVDGKTFDGFSPAKVRSIIDRLANGTYRAQPVRRVYIPKANGKKRPLGVPTTEDRLVQEVVRMLLEEIYEPLFSQRSHGFRPKRSCHTALEDIRATWTGVKWLVDVDVVGFFDNIDHDVLLGLLEKRIMDKRFLALVRGMLKAGYLENWVFHKTYSGTPQGGVVSPILANIYLHELDGFMDSKIASFTRGRRRGPSVEGRRIMNRLTYLRKQVDQLRPSRGGDDPRITSMLDEIGRLKAERMGVPATDAFDPNYRRLRYCRYADDFLIGVVGSKEDARKLMAEIRIFLADRLKLQVSDEKSGVHKASDGARFLGYEICTSTNRNPHRAIFSGRPTLRRGLADRIRLRVPRDRVVRFVNSRGWGDYDAVRPRQRPALTLASDVEIVLAFNAEWRGFANYYALADDVKRKLNKAGYFALMSCLKTLAAKHKSSVPVIAAGMRQGTDFYVRFKVRDEARVIQLWQLKHLRRKPRTWGGIDLPPSPRFVFSRTEMVERLNAQQCERCGRTDQPCEVHHVRRVAEMEYADLPRYMRAARQRKRVVLCRSCHNAVHAHEPTDKQRAAARSRGEPDALKGARPVRRGAERRPP